MKAKLIKRRLIIKIAIQQGGHYNDSKSECVTLYNVIMTILKRQSMALSLSQCDISYSGNMIIFDYAFTITPEAILGVKLQIIEKLSDLVKRYVVEGIDITFSEI